MTTSTRAFALWGAGDEPLAAGQAYAKREGDESSFEVYGFDFYSSM